MAGGAARCRSLSDALRAIACDVVHAHNVFPMIGYDVFAAAKDLGRPTIQTLHNYRLIATDRHLIGRDGARRPKDDSERRHHLAMLSRVKPGFMDEWLYTRAIASAWRRGIVTSKIDAFVCLTRWQRDLFIQNGLPSERLVVKPNFLDHRGPISMERGEYALYVGRLSKEKGADILAQAWKTVGVPLVVAGSGPLEKEMRLAGADMRGPQSMEAILKLMSGARFLVMNSIWHEPFGLVIIEAFASGTPCLVPNIGGLPEIVREGITGRIFRAGEVTSLVSTARQLWDEAPGMRKACRAEFEAKYTPEPNLGMLKRIYENVMARRRPDLGVNEADPTSLPPVDSRNF